VVGTKNHFRNNPRYTFQLSRSFLARTVGYLLIGLISFFKATSINLFSKQQLIIGKSNEEKSIFSRGLKEFLKYVSEKHED